MKQVEHDLEDLIRRFAIRTNDDRPRDVRLTLKERRAILAALRCALQVERLG
jgi:hypothetical protein